MHHDVVEQVDLLVVGCGAGGLAAATSHLEHDPDARVLLMERTSELRRGGNTAWSGAHFRLYDDGTPSEDLAERIRAMSHGVCDMLPVAIMQDAAPSVIQWLRGHGVHLEPGQTYFPTTIGPRLVPAGGGAAIVDRLAAAATSLGAEIRYHSRAVAIRREPSGDLAVTVESPSGEYAIASPNVVLACGSFQGNPELLEEYLGPTAEMLAPITPGTRSNKGEGISMGVSLGADLSGDFRRFHGEPVDPRSRVPEALVMAYPYGILVDRFGRRFVDEAFDTPDNTFEEIAFRIWRDQHQEAYLVGDATIVESPGFHRAMLTDRPPIEADSLAELEAKLGLPPHSLETTISRYNAAVVPGNYDPTRLDGCHTEGIYPPKSHWARALADPPWRAWPIACALTFTFGGLRTNTNGNAVDASGAEIAGLFAVGELAGDYYHNYPNPTSVLRALTFGRIAGAVTAEARRGVTAP
jgi:tricarballylate dehydrogenase